MSTRDISLTWLFLVMLLLTLAIHLSHQSSVTLYYYPQEGRLFSSDSYFINMGANIQGGYCNGLLPDNFQNFGSSAFCYSDESGLTILLGYGFTIDGIQSGKDYKSRNIIVQAAGTLSLPNADMAITVNPSRNSYLVLNGITSGLVGVKLDYLFSTSDAKVNQYLANRFQTTNPIISIPLTELTGSDLAVTVTVNATLMNVATTTSYTITGVNTDRRVSWEYAKSSYKCVNYNCFIHTMVNETLNSDNTVSINYYSGSNPLPSYNNYQLAKLTPSILPLYSSSNVQLTTQFSTSTLFSSNINTNLFSLLNGYFLRNGDKVHSFTQPITIILESRDTNAYPLEAISSLVWSCTGLDLSQYTNKRYLVIPANAFKSSSAVISAELTFYDTTKANVSTTLYLQNIGNLTLLIDPPSPYLTSGTNVNLVTYVNVNPSLISSVTYDDTSSKYITYLSTNTSFTSSSSAIFAILKADIPGPINIKQTVTLKSGVSIYNKIMTTVMPRYPLVGGCNILPNYGVAYEDLFGISCPMLDETKISSVILEVFQGTDKLLTLFNTKIGNAAVRLPVSSVTNSNNVVITVTDNYGYSQKTSFGYSANMNLNYPTTILNRIEKIQYFISETKARNYQTASNYAILLSMLTNQMLSGADSSVISQFSTQFTSLLDFFITELETLRNTIFHISVYDKAVPLLSPLFREIIDFSDKVALYSTMISSTRKQSLVKSAEFLISNDKLSLLSTRDRAAIIRVLGTVTTSEQTTYWNVTSLVNIGDFNTAFRSQLSKLDTMFSRGLDLSPFGFKKQIHKFSTLSDMALAQRTFSGLTVELPGAGFSDFGYPSNSYSLFMASYDISPQVSGKNFYLGVGKYSRFSGNVLYGVEVARSDGTTLSVAGLVSPILLTMSLTLDGSVLPSNVTFNLTCRYLDETSNVWSSSGIVTEIFSISSTSAQVKCKTNHLSIFTVFSDYVVTDITPTTSDTTNKNKLSGLSAGEIAVAAVVPTVVVFLLLLIVLAIIIFLIVRMRRKSKSPTPITDSELKLKDASHSSEQYDHVTIEMGSSNMFISDYKSVNSNTVPSYSSIHSTESSVTTPNSNIINKKYEILEKIGAGGFGAVFRSKNLFFNQKSKTSSDLEYYAIKKIQLSGLSELNDKFKEAVNMFKIKHENLVSLEDAVVDESSNSLYLIMKFYGNGDLDHFVKTKRILPESVLKQIIIQVCSGLKYLEEERGLIHRDIKPSNIFVENFDSEKETIKVVVSDFGLAKESNMMSSVSFAGTPFFMNPQALIGAKYSYNADIFSLGCSIYLMITHDMSTSIAQLYFQKQPNLGQVHEFIKESIRKATMNSSVTYSEDFLKILLNMLEFDAEVRPNAAKVLEIIENSE